MKHSFVILYLIASFSLPVHSQYQPLKLGDLMPDLAYTGVYNGTSDTLRFADLRGRWIVLDFWGVFCLPCIGQFSHLDSLQHRYRGQLQIIAVNQYLNKDSTHHFFTIHPRIFRPDIPFLTANETKPDKYKRATILTGKDTILEKLFPHYGVPFLVWIDPSGHIASLTDDHGSLNDENLNLAFAGKLFKLRKRRKPIYINSLMDSKW